jgi:tetratricopeptide (TPR) repeat protein
MISFNKHAGIILVCLAFLSVGLLRVNDLSLYTPDSIRYLIWGNSLAHGKGFVDDTQPDPDRYIVHAPFVSVLLAPIEIVYPLSVQAAKVLMVLFGLLALILFYIFLSRLINNRAALIGVAVFACNPLTIIYSSEILSEIPFIACIFLIFLLCEKYCQEERFGTMHFISLLIAQSIAILLRDVGVAIVVGVVILFLQKKSNRRAIISLIVPLLFYGLWYLRNEIIVGTPDRSQIGNFSLFLQHFVTPVNASLVNEFALRLWLNLKEYGLQIAGMLFYPLFSTQQHHLMLDISVLYQFTQSVFEIAKYFIAVIGIVTLFSGIKNDLKISSTAKLRLLFVAVYFLVIMVYPIHDIRFLFPLLPLMIYYFIVGIRSLFEDWNKSTVLSNRGVLIVIVSVVLFPNALGIFEIVKANVAYVSSPTALYEKIHSRQDYPAYYTHPWSKLREWINDNVVSGAVIASPSKELAAVVGERKVVELNPGLPLPQFEQALRDNDVGYILAPVRWSDLKLYELQMRESSRFWFELKMSIANLYLYKVHSRLLNGDFSFMQSCDDSLTASGLLRIGRKLSLNEEYVRAERIFSRALMLAPQQPELIYQHAVSYEMLGESTRAIQEYRKLFIVPQAGSYILLSRVHLQAIGALAQAQNPKIYEQGAVQTVVAARLYWSLGYCKRANRLMVDLFKNDSTYFVGLLWGVHFGLQLGDTAQAKDYLARLECLDVTNPVVQVFRHIIAIGDSLRSTTDSHQRIFFHLSIARLYRQIELAEEAIDETQYALRENPTDVDALLFLAKMFEDKSRLGTAEHIYRQVISSEPNNAFVLAKIDSIQVRLSKQ